MATLNEQQLETMRETLMNLTSLPSAPIGIEAALDQLETGNPAPAEEVFTLLLEQRVASGPQGLASAAEAACHLGDLASTHDATKATQAYLYAVQLDPEAAPAWNRLAAALGAEGKTDSASLAFRKALAFAVLHADHTSSAIATIGLGELAVSNANLPDAHKWWSYALSIFTEMGDSDRCAWVEGRLQDLLPAADLAATTE